MIIGFVLLVSACGTDFCDAIPVSDDIYLNRESCQLVMDIVHERRPDAVLICGEVQRDENEGEDE
ncbi:hypothetical protein Bresa_01795|uniref:Uncharacterized protein n=1 Tax=Brenneria salicis ATCC 15712 = DSM 30166 TaxID=714314 RepID=A0A366I6W2_9GAMM|nr:hypothetical protein [Brenneria salicis]NMN91597.1 hypothetical protein [Brenneria salicis ATCC 15712 = DSM 30166]RBP63068.1 hypothetical protein DES54_11383 [Brenneria salicis ATCC 15712 = DSM 30166]RLM30777.1 hypothetical protein BHG07_08580 [Brenneria salicis ATCC 15712 = DSM 30166]